MNYMPYITRILRKIVENIMALSLVVLAGSILIFSIVLSGFTMEIALARHDLPKQLDRIDGQIAEVQKILNGIEASGTNFQKGMNKGISAGIVDVPVSAVANVGYKISDAAATTGNQTYGFWQALKGKLMFWNKPATATPEISAIKNKK